VDDCHFGYIKILRKNKTEKNPAFQVPISSPSFYAREILLFLKNNCPNHFGET